MAELKHPRDFEEHVGRGAFRIYEGNPRYCPEPRRHRAHTFKYRYLDDADQEVAGEYLCSGDPMTFAKRGS